MYNLLIREKKANYLCNKMERIRIWYEFDWGNIFELPFKVTLESKLK